MKDLVMLGGYQEVGFDFVTPWIHPLLPNRAKNNRSKSVCTLFQRKRLSHQTVWLVIFGLTGPICARALKSFHLLELRPRGHQDWPVKRIIQGLPFLIRPQA